MNKRTKLHSAAEARKTHLHQRLLEITVEVVIAVALVVGIALYALHGPTRPVIEAKWVGFAGMTAIVFGNVVKVARPLWGKTKLWIALAALLLLHLILGWSVIRQFERVPLVWFVPATVVEVFVLLKLTERIFSDDELAQSAPSDARHN